MSLRKPAASQNGAVTITIDNSLSSAQKCKSTREKDHLDFGTVLLIAVTTTPPTRKIYTVEEIPTVQ